MNDERKLTRVTIEELLRDRKPLSKGEDIQIAALEYEQTDHVCLWFHGRQVPESHQTPEGPHHFLFDRLSLVEQLKEILCLIDPQSEQQIAQDLRRIADKLDRS